MVRTAVAPLRERRLQAARLGGAALLDHQAVRRRERESAPSSSAMARRSRCWASACKACPRTERCQVAVGGAEGLNGGDRRLEVRIRARRVAGGEMLGAAVVQEVRQHLVAVEGAPARARAGTRVEVRDDRAGRERAAPDAQLGLVRHEHVHVLVQVVDLAAAVEQRRHAHLLDLCAQVERTGQRRRQDRLRQAAAAPAAPGLGGGGRTPAGVGESLPLEAEGRQQQLGGGRGAVAGRCRGPGAQAAHHIGVEREQRRARDRDPRRHAGEGSITPRQRPVRGRLRARAADLGKLRSYP